MRVEPARPQPAPPGEPAGAAHESAWLQRQAQHPQRPHQPQEPPPPPPPPQPRRGWTGWLRSATGLHVVMAVVSALMGAVVVAFLLFCVLIYRIRPLKEPPTRANGNHLLAPVGAAASQRPLQVAPAPQAPLKLLFPAELAPASTVSTPLLAALCDPLTGQSPVHLLRPPRAPAPPDAELEWRKLEQLVGQQAANL